MVESGSAGCIIIVDQSPTTPRLSLPLAYAALALSMTLVGSYVGLSRWLVGEFPVFVLAGLRFAIAALCLLPWLRRRRGEALLRRMDHLRLFAASLIGTFLFSLCMLQGIAWSSAVAAGIVMATLPGVVALFARAWLKEPVGRRTLAGIGCAMAGVALVSLQGEAGEPAGARAWLGNTLLLAAVACEACYVVLGRQLAQSVSPQRITSLVNLWGLALTLPWALWQLPSLDTARLGWLHGGVLLYYAVAASVVSVWLWMLGMRQVPAARAGVYTACLPVASALVGLVLGESLGWMKAVALGLALLGVVLATGGSGFSRDGASAPHHRG